MFFVAYTISVQLMTYNLVYLGASSLEMHLVFETTINRDFLVRTTFGSLFIVSLNKAFNFYKT